MYLRNSTVLLTTRWMLGNSAATVSYWQADYIDAAIHEMLHLAGWYSGYSDTQLAVLPASCLAQIPRYQQPQEALTI